MCHVLACLACIELILSSPWSHSSSTVHTAYWSALCTMHTNLHFPYCKLDKSNLTANCTLCFTCCTLQRLSVTLARFLDTGIPSNCLVLISVSILRLWFQSWYQGSKSDSLISRLKFHKFQSKSWCPDLCLEFFYILTCQKNTLIQNLIRKKRSEVTAWTIWTMIEEKF